MPVSSRKSRRRVASLSAMVPKPSQSFRTSGHFPIKPPVLPRSVEASKRERVGSIFEGELALVQRHIELLNEPELFRIEAKKNIITVQEKDKLRYSNGSGRFDFLESFFDTIPETNASYTSMLRFILVDGRRRLFVTERYCFREDVEDWIFLDGLSKLQECVRKYVPHLGKDSFYSLRP